MLEFLKHADLARRRYQFRLSRKLGLSRVLEDVAEQTWEIAPAQRVETPPSVFLDGQFEKARVIEAWSSREVEIKRVFGGVFERPPLVARRFADAMLHLGAIHCGRAEKPLLPLETPHYPARDFPVLDIEEGALAGSYLGLAFFGHWLSDDAPLALLASKYGEPISPKPPALHTHIRGGGHFDGYVRLLDLPWRAAENVRFRSLILFDDEEFTSHKGDRLEQLRNTVCERLGAPRAAGRRVFIKRGHVDRGGRRFINEGLVAEELSRDGFDILEPAKASVEEIAAALYGATLIAGVEGSHLMHATFFSPPALDSSPSRPQTVSAA